MKPRVWQAVVLCAFHIFGKFYVCNCENVASACVLKETCGDCIRTPGCTWCSKPLDRNADDGSTLTRCTLKNHTLKNWCPQEYIIDRDSQVEILEDVPLRGMDRTRGDMSPEDAVQLRPQKLRVSLRPGTEVRIPFQYRQAEDYPVDLYYLMDLSNSMADDKDKISTLGDKIASLMNNVTNNFQIGFGSFIDKPEMPFVNTAPERLRRPCSVKGTNEPCVPAYGFKNHLPLTRDSARFAREVKAAKVSGNIDSPEGGFDAIMQALVCTEEIGWRPKARHMLVFSTDSSFHLAGDGKLAGIVEPNDEQCHLDASGDYTHSLITDYPSIWQLDKRAKENHINIIFAVTQSQELTYKELRNTISGASYGTLSEDSSNVVDLVKREYDKMVSSAVITDNAGGSLEVKYFSACLGVEERETSECGGIHGRPTINFTAVIKAHSCPENKLEWKETIKIRPLALDENIDVEVEIICDCPCESQGQVGYEPNSKTCLSSGSLQCGICACNPGRFGRFCECDGNQVQRFTDNVSQCIPKKDVSSLDNTEVCSGRGTCKCGKCDCSKRQDPNELVYGTFCECDNFSCERPDGVVCSGPEKGRCDCGKCICQAGWGGTACDCRETNDTCIASDSYRICSGRGNCVCGSCQCGTIDNVRYSGRFCEECPSCPGQRCNELMKCVECQAYQTGPLANDCLSQCTQFQVQLVDKITDVQDDETNLLDVPNDIRICRTPDDSGCTIVFKYLYEEATGRIDVWAQKTKECGRGVDILAIIGGVVGSTVLAGIILLIIWKVLTSVHDRREYTKFETERRKAQWDRGDNPLYKPSTSTFTNPTFFQS